ncbi:LCP family protein [Nonomuraea sp. B12E4]|uniref:LCP family protein n=1 Tax=Nonomuraea sp. B12E4 TaxID=3153564 RepID=UPI00325E6333
MDDLKLLRDLGAAIEHEPPATLARQRQRLLRAHPRGRRTGRWVAWWTAGLVVVATAAAVVVPTVLVSDHRHTAAPPGASRPVDMSGARNVLVIGSDTRDGPGNAKYGPNSVGFGKRSDTIIIVHVPADRGRATAVSVPRDSMVEMPRCGSSPAAKGMINSAYNTGGASCLRATLERLTGLTIQHTVEVDFAGFKGMVDALGGVEVTLPKPVDDPKAKLKLPAGRSVVNGEQALGYVRTRYFLGDGADVARIKRQQQFMLAMLNKAKRLPFEPAKLGAFLGEMRKSVKTDLSLESMYELAIGMSKTKMTFATVPSKPYPQDRNRLVWKQPEADKLFKSLR